MSVSVQTEPFDVAAEMAAMTEGNRDIGAVVSFTGLVRETTEAGAIEALELEHYPGMTEQALEDIVAEARDRWPLQNLRLIHRYGAMAPGEGIVMVLTASRHRQAAFQAAEFLMDYLKTKAPFWKKETGAHGGAWVDARESDDAATKRWEKSR
ncbi:MAG: molybdopterin synthase catalytic subunit MoaE [Pseudomonadota bacterium]